MAAISQLIRTKNITTQHFSLRKDVGKPGKEGSGLWDMAIAYDKNGLPVLRVRDGTTTLNFGVAQFRALMALIPATVPPVTPAPESPEE